MIAWKHRLRGLVRSFRMRLAVSAALMAGAVLLAFAGTTLWLVRQDKMGDVEDAIRSHAEREAGKPPHSKPWDQVEERMAASLGLRNSTELFLLVTDEDGAVIYRSQAWPQELDPGRFGWPVVPMVPVPREDSVRRVRPVARTQRCGSGKQRWLVGLGVGASTRVAVVVDGRAIDEDMREILWTIWLIVPLALALIAAGAWYVSGRALRSLHRLSQAVRQVNAEGLGRRLESEGEDREFRELLAVFNAMLERLDRNFQQARRFSADAAHELRTPLAIVQGRLEMVMHAAEPESSLQVEVAGILEDVRHLSAITGKLLMLAQADAGTLPLQMSSFDLAPLLETLSDDAALLGPELSFQSSIPTPLPVVADEILLRQVFHNLLNNAVRYNVSGGWIRLTAAAVAGGFEVRISNSCGEFPQEAMERVFERFYRMEASPLQHRDGVGLGLAISREIARAHGGTLTVCRDDGSVTFCLALPH